MSLNLIYKVALPSQSWVTINIQKREVNERIKVLILLTNSIMQIEKPYIYIYIYIYWTAFLSLSTANNFW